MAELEIVARLQEIFSRDQSESSDSELLVGIGDDAAFFLSGSPSNGIVIATDLLTEGTHFRREWSDLYSIGRKAAAANLADIFAMGTVAKYLLVAVAFRPEDGEAIFELARGIADECAKVGARVIGGDIARGSGLTVSITAVGMNSEVVTRHGAQVGDRLYLATSKNSFPGRSFLGLEQLRRGIVVDTSSIDLHRVPVVDYQEFIAIAKVATSLCDISDGLVSDAGALARSSNVSIEIESAALLAHPSFAPIAAVATKMELEPLEVVLASGEEHGPLFTGSAELSAEIGWPIGRVIERIASDVIVDGQPLKVTGFQHF